MYKYTLSNYRKLLNFIENNLSVGSLKCICKKLFNDSTGNYCSNLLKYFGKINFTEYRKNKFVEYYKKYGGKVEELSNKFGVSKSTIIRWKKEFGFSRKTLDERKNEILKVLKETNYSVKNTALILNLDYYNFIKWINKYPNIKRYVKKHNNKFGIKKKKTGYQEEAIEILLNLDSEPKRKTKNKIVKYLVEKYNANEDTVKRFLRKKIKEIKWKRKSF